MPLKIAPIPPSQLDAALDDVARLRIAVFPDFTYLYGGDMNSERDYIANYRESANAIVVDA